ncbi:TIGR03757 family integrating conjugative element protein [Pseudomonas sp. FME51]|uniref:TIGR03757 family integrating conjugative element protein n=1 Tax=Pseudomonas sp. FME51 TaxID=2742609 RepID=UPI00186802C4|nr:TIGR03757 family integrating conjugative element protein [Pseudomonas sp. FME51]
MQAHLGRILALLSLLLFTNVAHTSAIWVVTDAHHVMIGSDAAHRVIMLDAPLAIERELSSQLPLNPQQAAVIVEDRLKKGGHALQQRLREAYQGVTDAWSLGITSIPAVVVDQRYVVYGESDLDQALARIKRHREGQP